MLKMSVVDLIYSNLTGVLLCTRQTYHSDRWTRGPSLQGFQGNRRGQSGSSGGVREAPEKTRVALLVRFCGEQLWEKESLSVLPRGSLGVREEDAPAPSEPAESRRGCGQGGARRSPRLPHRAGVEPERAACPHPSVPRRRVAGRHGVG